MGEFPEVRIGTAEREEAMALLGEHFSAGRLTLVEFDERVAAAGEARTRGDLIPLFADLPSAPAFLDAPSRADAVGSVLPLVVFACVALLVLVVVRHPIVMAAALLVLFVVGRQGYRLFTTPGPR